MATGVCSECNLYRPHYCKCDEKECVVCGRVQEKRHENMYCDACYPCKLSSASEAKVGQRSYSVPLCGLCGKAYQLQVGFKSVCGSYVLCGECGKDAGPWIIGAFGPRPRDAPMHWVVPSRYRVPQNEPDKG